MFLFNLGLAYDGLSQYQETLISYQAVRLSGRQGGRVGTRPHLHQTEVWC